MSSKKTLSLWLVLAVAAATNMGARADQVDNYVTEKMKNQHIPGLSLAVLKSGKPVKVKGYGFANLELEVPVTPETVFKIGSLSKQFIAAGIVLLNADGKVGLDDPIRKYLEDAPEAWQPITVRHLLTHTSGLVREAPAFDFMKVQSDADTIRSAYGTPLVFPVEGMLVPESKTRFFNEDDTRLTYVFVRDKEGNVQLVREDEQGKENQRWMKQE